MSIECIKIENFTVFDSFNMDCTKGINVIIGENGTGKIHLMKSVYMTCNNYNPNKKYFDPVLEYFQTSNDELIRNLNKGNALISSVYDTNYIQTEIPVSNIHNIPNIVISSKRIGFIDSKAIFIPAKDMLTHSKGFLSWYNERLIPFDKSYVDIISKAMMSNLREVPEIGKNILPKLEKIIGGKVIIDNEVFFIENSDGKRTKFDIVAEGIKRFALIWQLIMNGCIEKGSVIFWDEPEANINPSLIKDIVSILLELSKNDVQIFVTTHNYMFAQYIEVMMSDEEVSFHSLYKENEGDAVSIETENKFSLLTHNKIIKENINLYDAEIEKIMGDIEE